MRLLFVVQRYGAEVAGGAEVHCREFATRLAVRGHVVDVLTSRARTYVDWADEYPSGSTGLDGVTVHRLSVGRPRHIDVFAALDRRVPSGSRPVPLFLQREWMRLQGPDLPEQVPWLAEHAARYDVVVFFTYLYATTVVGLPAAAGRTATALHPLAHDEPPLSLPLFDTVMRLPTALVFNTPEEATLVARRFRVRRPSHVAGIGVSLDVHGDSAAFRAHHGLGDRPYLLNLGRLDPAKGTDELFDFFVAYKRRRPGPLALVLAGEPVHPVPPHPDVVATGFVDEATKHAALAGCHALVHPSYFESFSMVLTEAWAHRKPALVQGHCEVLVGQARRSRGAVPYRGYAEFEVALDLVLADDELARRLGAAGRAYVERHFDWERVMDGYEAFLASVAGRGPARVRP